MSEAAIRARAERMRAAVLEQIPEARPLIASLVAEGLIDGWRNVTYIGTDPGRPSVQAVVFRREQI